MNQSLSEMTRIGIKNVEIVINSRRDADITNVGDVKRTYVENGCISLAPVVNRTSSKEIRPPESVSVLLS